MDKLRFLILCFVQLAKEAGVLYVLLLTGVVRAPTALAVAGAVVLGTSGAGAAIFLARWSAADHNDPDSPWVKSCRILVWALVGFATVALIVYQPWAGALAIAVVGQAAWWTRQERRGGVQIAFLPRRAAQPETEVWPHSGMRRRESTVL